MDLTKEEVKEGDRKSGAILMIFSECASLRKHLPDMAKESYRLLLLPEDTGLAGEVEIELVYDNGSWFIDGKELSDKAPYYHYTERNEKLLLLMAEKRCFIPAGCIFFKEEENLKIGNAFKNQVFFESFSLIESVHAKIRRRKQAYVVEGFGFEGIYINEKILKEKEISVYSGDRMDIYGLHFLFLGEMIVCIPFSGICRVTGQYGNLPEGVFPKVQSSRERKWVERKWAQEEELHGGEVEILMPEKTSSERRQSPILSFAPTITMVIPMLLMAQMMSRYMEGAGGSFYYMSALMSGCSAGLALFWGLVGYGYEKHIRKGEERERERQYREYREEKKKELFQYQSDNRRILEQRYPALTFFLGGNEGTPAVLWNRYYRQDDFLFFRFGTGEMPFQVKIKLSGHSKNIVQGKLAGETQRIVEEFAFLKEVPIGVNFYKNRQIGIVGDMTWEGVFETVLSLCVQIAACHCYTEVKMVCFYQEERCFDRGIASCLRWMPHSWSGDKNTRFLAGNEKEAGEILPVLTKELMKGSESEVADIKIPWYIVLILNEELILGEPLHQCLIESKGIYPVNAVFVGKNREALPKSCRCFIEKVKHQGEILNLGLQKIERQSVYLEKCSLLSAQRYIRQIAGLQVQDTEAEGQLPGEADFLQLYGCGRVEELCSRRRWELSRTEERMKVPLGLGAGGRLVSLDVHEKFHGPHGLIAGTTGSGKSELLQTYLLSIAVNFSPEDVNFFMIDYKGGGTGNLLKDLPHCAGVISNLSGKQIKRAMSAIASENRRRQKLFNDFQVNHIDAYTRLHREGKIFPAMPHLLLVIDEFAELKKEEPEFMQEIISLAQVGRSLGVHLILATQKPAGTVDDKIWSNARFRLCLRVQDRQDSMDMLHSDDAAALTAPGQCYLQIGNHEYYELFQAGYCGSIYAEEGERKAKAALLSNTGRRMVKEETAGKEKGKNQMEVLIDYIQKTAENSRYFPAAKLWLPELPGKIFLSGLKRKEKEIVIGLCDDPENQCHFPMAYCPQRQGHLAVCGSPGSGKTTFLQTILWQLSTEFLTEEVLFLVVDIRQEGLTGFNAMPHCLGRLGGKADRDVFFHHLECLMMKRKKKLSGISFEQYRYSGKERLPFVFVAVDNYGTLRNILEEQQEELILKLAAEGLTLGIYLLISASGAGEIGGKLYEKIRTGFALEMSDRFQYGDVLRQYYIPVLPEENQKGRGLCKTEGRVLEFQTALFAEEQTGYGCIKILEETGKKLRKEMENDGKVVPAKFPEIPREVSYEKLAADFDWKEQKLPLGYCLSTGRIYALSLERCTCFLVSGNRRSGKINLLCCLIEGALHLQDDVVIVDTEKRLESFRGRKGLIYLGNEEEMEGWRGKQKGSTQKVSVFISGIGRLCSFVYRFGTAKEERIKFWEEAAAGSGRIGFLAGIYSPDRDYETAGCGFFRKFTTWQQGIHLGGNAVSQRVFAFDDLGYARQNQPEPPGVGYLKAGAGSATLQLRLPFYEQPHTEEVR